MQLFNYCRSNNWAGYDPYDALNSRLFNATPLSKSRVCRIAFTQVLKRLPINLRPLLAIPKEQNAKALALFLTASLKLSRLGLLEDQEIIKSLADRLLELRSPDPAYWCWGYSFPWQTRTVLVPKGAPNLVCTTFAAEALIDAYEQTQNSRYLDAALSASEYILDCLFWKEGDAVGFSYPVPSVRSRVHNANFLGAALLSRAYKLTGEGKFKDVALAAARYSAARQNTDGSWYYGESRTQHWIDNFHTGYNLCALASIGQNAETPEFESCLVRGFHFYKQHFFREDAAPRYFHDRTYPIDIHCVAQSIITLLRLGFLDKSNVGLAHSITGWAISNLWNQEGYFHYRSSNLYTSKISYMRWSQAWMLLALSALCDDAATRGH